MKKILMVIALAMMVWNALAAATYYAHCTTISKGHGSVYVTKAEGGVDISSITDWKSDEDDTSPERSGEGDCTVYAYAKADEGYAFAGWYRDEDCTEQESTNNLYEKVIHAGARVPILAANQKVYAKFSAVLVPITGVTLKPASQGYDGTEKSVTVTVKAGDVTLGLDDYEIVSGTTSGVLGSLTEDIVTTVTVRGKGGYTGEQSADWSVVAPSGSFAAPTCGSGCLVDGTVVTLVAPRDIGATYDAQKGTWKVSVTVNWPKPVNESWSGLTPGHAEYIDAAHAFVQVGDAVYSGCDILDPNTSTPDLKAETGEGEYAQGLGNKVGYTYFKSATYTIEFSVDDIEAAKASGRIEQKIMAWSLAWAGTAGDKKNQYSKTGLRATTYTLTIPIDEKFVLTDKFGNQVYPKPLHKHEWKFSGSYTDVITATCKTLDPPCAIKTVGIGLVAENREYNGKPYEASLSNVTAFATALGREIVGEIEYYDENGELLDSAPTRAGIYMAAFTVEAADGLLLKEFAITRPSGGYASGWELARQDVEECYWACYDSVADAAQAASDGDTVYYRGQGTDAINLDRETCLSSDADITVNLGGKTFTRNLSAEMHICNELNGKVTLVNGILQQPTNGIGVEGIHFDGKKGSRGVIVLGEGIKVVNVARVSGFLKLHANSVRLNIVDGEYDIADLAVSDGGEIAITGGRFGLSNGHPIKKDSLAKFVDSAYEVSEISGAYKYEVVLRKITTLKIPVANTGYTYAVSNGTAELVGELKDGTNTYEVAAGDLVEVHFTLKDRYRWRGEIENPMTIGPIAGDTVVDAGDLPTAERIPLTPGDVAGPYDGPWAALAAIFDNPLTPTDEVRSVLEGSELTEDAYTKMFNSKYYQSDDGKYYITYVLSPDATSRLVQSANVMVAGVDLAKISALSSGMMVSLVLEGGIPGFYYTLEGSESMEGLGRLEGVDVYGPKLCGNDGKVIFSNVKKPSDAMGFFVISVRERPGKVMREL